MKQHLPTAALLGALVITSTDCTSQEERLRQIRYGFRELNLPMQLDNDELALKRDELSNDIAHQKGKPKEPTRIAVDTFMIEQDKAAIEIMNRFAEIWSFTIDHGTMKVTVGDTGIKELQRKFSEMERRFDAANTECHKHADSPPFDYVAPKTVKEAEARCAGLRKIYAAVIPEATSVQRTFASAPARTGGCVSEIDEVSYFATVESSNHKIARQNKDKAQQRCDETLSAMKQESAKCKNLAETSDETDADQTERLACVQEENRLSAIGNTRYAELNATVRRLNAATESEKSK